MFRCWINRKQIYDKDVRQEGTSAIWWPLKVTFLVILDYVSKENLNLWIMILVHYWNKSEFSRLKISLNRRFSCVFQHCWSLCTLIVGIRLSCQIMESEVGVVTNFVWSSVWRGWQVQSSSGSLCHRWCSRRWMVGWSPATLDAPSCIVSSPPAACFACPHQSLPLFEQHSFIHCGRLLSTARCLGQCLQV